MKKGVILFDTCAFVRLCSYLGSDFFEKKIVVKNNSYKFAVHEFVGNEIRKKSALSIKYSDLPHFDDIIYKPPKRQTKDINENISIFQYTASEMNFSPPLSNIDIKCLVYQNVNSEDIITCTDDMNMIRLAKVFDLPCFSSIEILMELHKTDANMIFKLNDYKSHLVLVLQDWPNSLDKLLKKKYNIILP